MKIPKLRIDTLTYTLYSDNTLLTKNVKKTYLSADMSSASGTLTVDSIVGFAINQILLIGEFGNEDSEIIKTHATTAPSGSTVTLASNTVFAHPQGTTVYIINYDQIDFRNSATVAGTKTSLTGSPIALQADALETQLQDDTNTSGYGFIRFMNTIPTPDTYSAYSDYIPYTGYGSNTVGYIIDYALKRNGLDDFTSKIDHDYCIEEINSCIRYITGQKKKWTSLQEFDAVLGQTEESEYSIAVPSDMWGYSNKGILDIHLEGRASLTYKDEREWNDLLVGTIYDTLSAAALAAATTVYLTNSFSFGDTGTFLCRGDLVDYTVNATATGKLTVTALDSGLADGSMAWTGTYQTGNPQYYTVKDGYIYFYPIPTSAYASVNVMIDYWKVAPVIDSDADTIDMFRFDLVKYWLTASVRAMKNNQGIRNDADGDYQMFERILNRAIYIDLNSSGEKYKMKPKINSIKYN